MKKPRTAMRGFPILYSHAEQVTRSGWKALFQELCSALVKS